MTIYLIGHLIGLCECEEACNAQDIVKATTSYESARQCILDELERLSERSDIYDFKFSESEAKYCWDLHYSIGDAKIEVAASYRIAPIELDEPEDVPEVRKPELEKRCEALEKHNDELKKEISELKKSNSAAQCYLTFWDGGIYEDFDHLLKNVNAAKSILGGGEKGNTLILKLFEDWKKNEKE